MTGLARDNCFAFGDLDFIVNGRSLLFVMIGRFGLCGWLDGSIDRNRGLTLNGFWRWNRLEQRDFDFRPY